MIASPRSMSRTMDDTASLVCKVEKTRWPVMAAWTAWAAVSKSRNLTDHHDIRVLAQNISQYRGEGDINERLYGNLIEFLMDHFHRVFHGHQVHFRSGRSLLGPNRALSICRFRLDRSPEQFRGERCINDLKIPAISFGKTKVLDRLKNDVRIKNPHNRLFSKGDRNGRNSYLNILVTRYSNLDPAVLRAPFFGNIESRQKFNACN